MCDGGWGVRVPGKPGLCKHSLERSGVRGHPGGRTPPRGTCRWRGDLGGCRDRHQILALTFSAWLITFCLSPVSRLALTPSPLIDVPL